jgi:DNA-directed RNA polymerase specialized sigma24 family protein
MNDPQSPVDAARVVAALRAQEQPGALALLFDSYGDRLFRYCWFMLRNRDIAQVALRDSLVVAQAHAARLADPDLLSSWLYAITRTECRRRRPVAPGEADEPPARPSQVDADSRLMAWQAVTSIATPEMEALELACRHHVDLGLVLGCGGAAAGALLGQARESLERALGAEIFISRGGHTCPDRAQVLRGWSGTVTAEMRGRVLRHAAGCPACRPSLPRNVSAARVFALLPVPSLPPGTRQRVLEFFADERMSAYREFAVARAADLGPSGFPAPAITQGPVPGSTPTANPASAAVPPGSARTAGSLPAASGTPANAAGPGTAAPGPGTRRKGQPGGPRRTEPARDWKRALPRRPAIAGAITAAVLVAAAAAAAVLVAGRGGSGAAPRIQPPGQAAQPEGGRAVRHGSGAGAMGAARVPATPRKHAAVFPRPLVRPPGNDSGVTLIAAVTQRPSPGPGGSPPTAGPAPGASHPAEGYLEVSPGELDLGQGRLGQLTITGYQGPVTWSARTSSGQLELSSASGTVPAGQAVTLTVTVNDPAGQHGSGFVYVTQPGGASQEIQVTWSDSSSRPPWTEPPPSPSPSPTPTPTPTPPSPAPAPSPSPSPTRSTSPGPSSSPSPSGSSGSSPPAMSSALAAPSPRAAPSPAPRTAPAAAGRL